VLVSIVIGEDFEISASAGLPHFLCSIIVVIDEDGRIRPAPSVPHFLCWVSIVTGEDGVTWASAIYHFLCWATSLLVRILKLDRPPRFPNSSAALASLLMWQKLAGLHSSPLLVLGNIVIGVDIETGRSAAFPKFFCCVSIFIHADGQRWPAAALPPRLVLPERRY
jgi:hypothetical protein